MQRKLTYEANEQCALHNTKTVGGLDVMRILYQLHGKRTDLPLTHPKLYGSSKVDEEYEQQVEGGKRKR